LQIQIEFLICILLFSIRNPRFEIVLPTRVYPNVAYPRRGKTRQSAPDVGERRLGQDEQYLTVREILPEASTLTDGVLSREWSDFYRFGCVTLGFRGGDQHTFVEKTVITGLWVSNQKTTTVDLLEAAFS
jgi:hypothetical protein